MDRGIVLVLITLLLSCTPWMARASDLAAVVEQTSLIRLPLKVNDVVYDSTRDRLYVSVPSSEGTPYGNTITKIDPSNGAIVGSRFVGSEPNKLAISADASRVYVGIDGANSFCWWEPGTDATSPFTFLTNRTGIPSLARDIVVWPGDSRVVVILRSETSNYNADLAAYTNGTPLFSVAESYSYYASFQIAFANSATLISSPSSSSTLKRWRFTLSGMTNDASLANFSVGSDMNVINGTGFGANGKVFDVASMTPLGTYATSAGGYALQAVPELNMVCFFGSTYSSGATVIEAFDMRNYTKLGTNLFAGLSTSTYGSVPHKLVGAGCGRMAYQTPGREFGIVVLGDMTPRMTGLTRTAEGFKVEWVTTTRRTHHLVSSTDLTAWTPVGSKVPTLNSAAITVNDSNAPNIRFFRVTRE